MLLFISFIKFSLRAVSASLFKYRYFYSTEVQRMNKYLHLKK